MPKKKFLPYRFEKNSLEIRKLEALLDDEPVTDLVDIENCQILLASKGNDWKSIEIVVEVSDANCQLANVIATGKSEDCDLHLVLNNPQTRYREAVKLVNENGLWKGQVAIERFLLFGRTEIECRATLATDLVAKDGFASRRGERVASSHVWHLYTDTMPAMPGGALNSQWLDFADSQDADIRKAADCVWILDCSDSTAPKLLLNEGVPELRTVLEVEGKTSKSARVRDSLIQSILQGALLELCNYALARSEPESGLEDLEDWQQKMLLSLARKCDSGTEEDIAESWISDWHSPENHARVARSLAISIQRHLNLFDSSRFLVKTILGDLKGD